MAKGILYCMISADESQGVVKIGKTTNFENRMREIESNGYRHFYLKRHYAVEVENVDAKETALHKAFGYCRLGDTELFAVDKDVVTSLMSSFDGTKIYPQDVSNEEVLIDAVENIKTKVIPDGDYYIKHNGHTATMRVQNGKLTLVKGSYIPEKTAPSFVTDLSYKTWLSIRENLLEDNKLTEDLPMSSVSRAGGIAVGRPSNGWMDWKNAEGQPIDIYRKKDEDHED